MYHLEIWNATGSSSRDNSLGLNNSSDPWNNIHQHQHNCLLHFSWNYLIYRTYTNPVQTTITSAINLLNSNQPQTITRCKRSLLPFLGTALSWLTGTATTKDICSIKSRINQLIATQSSQCNTLVHIISILNVTRYATQVNRHSINSLIDAIHTTTQDINNLYNLTTSLMASINFNQMILHIRSVFANL